MTTTMNINNNLLKAYIYKSVRLFKSNCGSKQLHRHTHIRFRAMGTFVAYYKKQWSEWKNRSEINHKMEQSAINQSDVEQSVTNQSDIEQSVRNQNTI